MFAKKSKKLLYISTALMIVGLAAVITVYAAVTLGTITGNTVTVGGVTSGTITYNTQADGSGTWSTTLQPSSSWYAKLTVNGGYTGPVVITWQLESYASGSWANAGAPVTTSVTLTGATQDIYATANGAITNNLDWSTLATTGGSYRLTAVIASAP
jgi:hypothetical protein